MRDLPTSWGETLPILVDIDDTTAVTATITIATLEGDFVLAKSGAFTDGSVDISLNATETQLPLGNYNYQLRIDYTGGRVDKFPDFDDCGDCLTTADAEDFKFPQVIVTPSLDMPGVS